MSEISDAMRILLKQRLLSNTDGGVYAGAYQKKHKKASHRESGGVSAGVLLGGSHKPGTKMMLPDGRPGIVNKKGKLISLAKHNAGKKAWKMRDL
jgi:hypothetical protein